MRAGPVVLAGALAAVSVASGRASALDERFSDLPASVEVAQVFTLSLDNDHLAFGHVTPSATIVLGGEGYYHEVRCRSNTGRAWYVKAQLLSLNHLESPYALPPGSLKWRLAEAAGGRSTRSRDFQSVAAEPVLIYASEGDEAAGAPVALRLQYSLTAPPDAPAGVYAGQLLFTMAESP